jgi:hypothetical protein
MVNERTLHRRAARILPEVIKTSGVLMEDAGENELAAMLFPLRRKSSGAVLFRLSTETITAMGASPLLYLKEAVRARQGRDRRGTPFAYKEWKNARIPAWLVPSILPRLMPQSLEADAETLQACFTVKTDGKALLVVIPGEQIAMYVWSD